MKNVSRYHLDLHTQCLKAAYVPTPILQSSNVAQIEHAGQAQRRQKTISIGVLRLHEQVLSFARTHAYQWERDLWMKSVPCGAQARLRYLGPDVPDVIMLATEQGPVDHSKALEGSCHRAELTISDRHAVKLAYPYLGVLRSEPPLQ